MARKLCLQFCLHCRQSTLYDFLPRSFRKIAHSGVDVDTMTDEDFRHYLYQDLPDIDLMIRTSGELRLSNFLLWQNSYAEFYFPKTKFPDFHEADFDQAIIEYTSRDRRFGGIKNS